MKLKTALIRLMQDPTKVIRRLGWADSRPSLFVKANKKQVAPSQDDVRWSSVLYSKRGKATLTVRDYITNDWTVRSIS